MSYTQYGPWTDGGAPGVAAEFLNPLETFLLSLNSASYDSHITANGSGVMTSTGQIVNGAIQSNPSATVLNGGTSGTATLYQPFTGSTYKKVIIVLNNFRTAGSTQSIALPVAFATMATIVTGDIGTSTTIAGINLLLSGVAQTVEIMTVPAVLGGTRNGATVFYGLSLVACGTGFDTVRFAASSAGPSTGLIVIEGV